MFDLQHQLRLWRLGPLGDDVQKHLCRSVNVQRELRGVAEEIRKYNKRSHTRHGTFSTQAVCDVDPCLRGELLPLQGPLWFRQEHAAWSLRIGPWIPPSLLKEDSHFCKLIRVERAVSACAVGLVSCHMIVEPFCCRSIATSSDWQYHNMP